MNKFKVGDRVVCVDDYQYGITTSEADLTVVRCNGGEIFVRLDGHRSPRHAPKIGSTYWVFSRHFKLAKPRFKGNI